MNKYMYTGTMTNSQNTPVDPEWAEHLFSVYMRHPADGTSFNEYVERHVRIMKIELDGARKYESAILSYEFLQRKAAYLAVFKKEEAEVVDIVDADLLEARNYELEAQLIVSSLLNSNDYVYTDDYLEVVNNATYKLTREYNICVKQADSFGEWIDMVRSQQGKLYIEWYTNNDIVDTWEDWMLANTECDSWSNEAGGA